MIYGTHVGGKGKSYDLSDLAACVNYTVRELEKHQDEFDCIVVRGMSGALIGSPVAIKLKVPLIVVRKPRDSHHNGGDSQKLLGGGGLGKKPLFLDDFISSGSTRRQVAEAVGKLHAQFLYQGNGRGTGFSLLPHPLPPR